MDQKLCKEHLKKMRSPKMDPLRKADLMKTIVKKCSSMASSKPVKCHRCGYMNGLCSAFSRMTNYSLMTRCFEYILIQMK